MTWTPMEPFRLGSAADNLNDIERTRINVENRLRARLIMLGFYDPRSKAKPVPVAESAIATLPARDPLLAELGNLAAAVKGLYAMEHLAELGVARALRAHPLGGWVKARKGQGVGPRQGGRLIAAIGDPYLRTFVTRDPDGTVSARHEPRTVAQLYAYAGYHVRHVPADTDQRARDSHPPGVGVGGPLSGSSDQRARDTQTGIVAAAGPSPAPHPDQSQIDSQARRVGVAVRREKNQQANWSNDIKMRAHNVAAKIVVFQCDACGAANKKKTTAGWAPPPPDCTCAETHPYRHLYDLERIKHEHAVHRVACAQCGVCGTCGGQLDRNRQEHYEKRGCAHRKVAPALPGSPLANGQKEARAVRVVAKRILKDLWRAARDWHHQQISADTDQVDHDSQAFFVGVGGTPLDVDHSRTGTHTSGVDVDLGSSDHGRRDTHDFTVAAAEPSPAPTVDQDLGDPQVRFVGGGGGALDQQAKFGTAPKDDPPAGRLLTSEDAA